MAKKKIRLEGRTTTTIDANMTAAIGALIATVEARGSDVIFDNLPATTRDSLLKNGFLAPSSDRYFVAITNRPWASISDGDGNRGRDDGAIVRPMSEAIIPYHSFGAADSKLFADYANTYLTQPQMPNIPVLFRKRLLQALNEIFNNSAIHAESAVGVFSSGRVNHRNIELTIADAGVGFRTTVSKYLNRKVAPIEAIHWAMSGDNTTRSGSIPGGLGLKLLRRFVAQNGGLLTVLSHNGLWVQSRNQVERISLRPEFNGTLLSVRVDLNTIASYSEQSDPTSDDIL